MRKRVALARSLALAPKAVLFDEPTAGLDPIVGFHILQMIRELQRKLGLTSVLVTHDLRSALYEPIWPNCSNADISLVTPRVLAITLILPVLTILADAVGLIGGWFISVTQLGVGSTYFYNSLMRDLVLGDLTSGLGKSVVFGFLIVIVACHRGLTATGGADGVGRATTSAVVVASISILVSDFFLTKLFLAL
jgi:Permease MlaE